MTAAASPARLRASIADHWLLVVVLVLAAALRLYVWLAYSPALLFYGDSWTYLQHSFDISPTLHHPLGYSVLLRLARPTHNLAFVAFGQHLLGLAVGAMLYAFCRRLGVNRVLAVLAAVPVLLDAYQLNVEQFLLAETVFTALVALALVLVLWTERPSPALMAGAGLLLAMATLTRTLALVLIVPLVVYALGRRLGVRQTMSAVLALAIPVLGYAAWFHSIYGVYALSGYDGRVLYGRVAPFADCARFAVPAAERPLCEPRPAAARPGPTFYTWDPGTPVNRLPAMSRVGPNLVAGDFARRVIAGQPGDYALVAWGDFAHYFLPGRSTGPRDWPVQSWQFVSQTDPSHWRVMLASTQFTCCMRLPDASELPLPSAVGPRPNLLLAYQGVAYTWGPLLALMVAAALIVMIGRPIQVTSRIRWAIFLLLSSSLAMLVIPSAIAIFDYRYVLPALALLPPAAALACQQLLDRATAWRSASGRQREPAEEEWTAPAPSPAGPGTG